jgi:hypothetical protein
MILAARATSARAIQSRSSELKDRKRSGFIYFLRVLGFDPAFHEAGFFFFHKTQRQFGFMDSPILFNDLGETPSPELRNPFISKLFNQFEQSSLFARSGSARWQINRSFFYWH